MAQDIEPTRQGVGRLQDSKSLLAALQHPDMLARMKAACPSVLSPERMLRVAALAVSKTKHLDECPMMEVLGAFLVLGSLGLEPNTPLGHAHLIPFAKNRKTGKKDGRGKDIWEKTYTLQTIIGYQGYIALAYRSGAVKGIHADVVYEGDEFSFSYGSDAHVRHVPKGGRKRKALWAYCHAQLPDGGQAFTVLPLEHILDIRNASQGYKAALIARNRDGSKGDNEPAYAGSPWVAHFHPMAAKTAVRALRAYLPMSIELVRAAALEDASGDALSGVFDTTAENIDLTGPSDGGFSYDQQPDQLTQEQPGPDLGLNENNREPDPVPTEQPVEKRDTPTEEPAVKPAPPIKETPPAKPLTFELFNADGESVWIGDNAVEWAEGFMALFDEDPNQFQKLRSINKDAHEAAMKIDKARMVLGNQPDPDPIPNDYAIEVYPTRGGADDVDRYLADLKEAVDGCDLPQLEKLVAANQPYYEKLPGAKKMEAMKIVSNRRRVL